MKEEKTMLGEALKLEKELKNVGNVIRAEIGKLELKILRAIAKLIGSW